MIKLCSAEDIANDCSKGFSVDNTSIFVVKKEDKLHVYLNSCPHRLIPLEWQPDQFLDYDKNFIQCSAHGALFSIDEGVCIAGPCPGDRLTMIDHEIREKELWISLDKVSPN